MNYRRHWADNVTYPALGYYYEGLVVLFTSHGVGKVVVATKFFIHKPVGYSSDTWSMEVFRPLSSNGRFVGLTPTKHELSGLTQMIP